MASIDSKASLLWISRGLEILWLVTIVSVPLAFFKGSEVLSLPFPFIELPKIALLRTLVGLMAILFLIEWGIKSRIPHIPLVPSAGPRGQLNRMKSWLGSHPANWVTLMVMVFLASIISSTVLSERLLLSVWGEIPGRDGTAAYTLIIYVLFFLLLVTHIKTRAQISRLMAGIIVMGVLVSGYGVLQHFGQDFFDINKGPESLRITSTIGNAVLAGSLILITTMVTLISAGINLRESIKTRRFWGKLGLWSLALAVQLLGLIFTFSRGPWVGLIVGVISLLLLTAIFVNRQTVAKYTLMLLAAGVFVLITVSIPYQPKLQQSPEDAIGYDPLLQDIAGRFVSIGTEGTTGTLGIRFRIWRDSSQLILHRPWFEFDDQTMFFARPIIGYGPDLFRSTFLLESRPVGPNLGIGTNQAHNYFLHNGVELGILGMVASLGMFIAIFLAGGYQLFRESRRYCLAPKLLLVGLLSAFAGRFVEQMVGVASVSDLTIFWALLAVFVALPAVIKSRDDSTNMLSRPIPSRNRSDSVRRKEPNTSKALISSLWRPAAIVFLVAGISILTWQKTINYARASMEITNLNELYRRGDFRAGEERLQRAIELAPDVYPYRNLLAEVYTAFYLAGGQTSGGPQRECTLQAGNVPYDLCLARKAQAMNLLGQAQRPLDNRAVFALISTTLSLASLTGDPELLGDAAKLYQRLGKMMPHDLQSRVMLAAVHIEAGQPQEAFPPLVEALAISGNTEHRATVLTLRGIALQRMGLQDRNLQERSLEDFDEAIRINPQHALAFFHRAVALTVLGRDLEADQDVIQVEQLDTPTVDGAILRQIIQGIKGNR